MRRSNLILALLLFVGAGLYVALVIVPQLHQAAGGSASVTASDSNPINPSILVGSWLVDDEASWDNARNSRQLSKTLASVPDEKVAQLRAQFLARCAASACQFTADKMILTENGVRLEVSYTIIAASGNMLNAESITDKGIVIQIKYMVTGDRLELFLDSFPGTQIVFRRVF